MCRTYRFDGVPVWQKTQMHNLLIAAILLPVLISRIIKLRRNTVTKTCHDRTMQSRASKPKKPKTAPKDPRSFRQGRHGEYHRREVRQTERRTGAREEPGNGRAVGAGSVEGRQSQQGRKPDGRSMSQTAPLPKYVADSLPDRLFGFPGHWENMAELGMDSESVSGQRAFLHR